MKVEDLLPRVAAIVDPDRISALCYAEFLGDGARHLEETLEHGVWQGTDLLQVRDVLLWDDENVNGSLAVYVFEDCLLYTSDAADE